MKAIKAFGIAIHPLTMKDAVSHVLSLAKEESQKCAYVVTPNVSHVCRLKKDVDFHMAYDRANLVVIDGRPVRLACRLLGHNVPETVPGSDLVPNIFQEACVRGLSLKVFLLGAGPGVAARAGAVIMKKWPSVSIVGCYSPPFGFEKSKYETKKIIDLINTTSPDLLIIGLGAPKQELWIFRNQSHLLVRVALCVGATIDFIAGEKKRAPRIFQMLGLEWLYRMLSEPRRLLGRYVRDMLYFPVLLVQEIFVVLKTKMTEINDAK